MALAGRTGATGAISENFFYRDLNGDFTGIGPVAPVLPAVFAPLLARLRLLLVQEGSEVEQGRLFGYDGARRPTRNVSMANVGNDRSGAARTTRSTRLAEPDVASASLEENTAFRSISGTLFFGACG
jgi:hypothetical protein